MAALFAATYPAMVERLILYGSRPGKVLGVPAESQPIRIRRGVCAALGLIMTADSPTSPASMSRRLRVALVIRSPHRS
jgi:hypothetical protein